MQVNFNNMRTIIIENLTKIKKAVPKIENSIKVKISFGRGQINIRGNELNEFLTEEIVRAIDFGFDVDDALLLKNEDFLLEFINIKSNTPRKNFKDIRARLIGTKGKAKKTIEKLTGSILAIKNNEVGIIVDSSHLDAVTQGIESLIRGAKHGNIFAYLEKQNAQLQRFDDEDLGLKERVKK